MVRRVPERPRFRSATEEQVWARLKAGLGPADVLLGNVAFTDDRGDREADLVVGIRDAGIVVIEVKGGPVRHDGQSWRWATTRWPGCGACSRATRHVPGARPPPTLTVSCSAWPGGGCRSVPGRGLAGFLQRWFAESFSRPAYVGTFADLGAARGVDLTGSDDSDFWERRLPKQMLPLARDLPPEDRFDALVVDEAQDFAASWWPPLPCATRTPAGCTSPLDLLTWVRLFWRDRHAATGAVGLR